MTAPTIETDLGTVLDQINQNLAEFRKETNQRFEQINQRFEQLNKDVTEIKVGQARLEERMTAVEGGVKDLKDEIKDLKTSQSNQIWALIGILGTVALGAVVRFVIAAMPAGKP
jgi:predicted nuclease with TOPRIM domain